MDWIAYIFFIVVAGMIFTLAVQRALRLRDRERRMEKLRAWRRSVTYEGPDFVCDQRASYDEGTESWDAD